MFGHFNVLLGNVPCFFSSETFAVLGSFIPPLPKAQNDQSLFPRGIFANDGKQLTPRRK